MPKPTTPQIELFLQKAQERMKLSFDVSLRTISDKLAGASFAEVEDVVADIARRYVLELPSANVKKIVNQRVALWQKRFQPK